MPFTEYTVETDIENRMLDMILAFEGFSDPEFLKAAFRGISLQPVTSHYPYIEVAILTWGNGKMMVGPKRERVYTGQIRYWLQHQDIPEVDEETRRGEVPSYLQVKTFMKRLDYLFSLTVNKNLQGLTFTSPVGQVTLFELTGGQYGIVDRLDAPNMGDNFGFTDFQVTTHEVLG